MRAGQTHLTSPPLIVPLRLGISISGEAHISRLSEARQEDLNGFRYRVVTEVVFAGVKKSIYRL